MARGDLTDAQWALIRRHVPVHPLGRLPRHLRTQFDGINWRFRTGAPWRDIPERYGNWNTLYQRLRQWRDAGVWLAILLGVIADAEAAGDIDWFISIDSTTNRAHQHAAGAVFDAGQLARAQAWLDARANQRNQEIKILPRTSRATRTPARPSAVNSANTAKRGPGRRNSAAPAAD